MTNFLHWRKMTWALVLWSFAMSTWVVIGSFGAAVDGLLWVVGAVGLGLLWLTTQPPFRQGRSFRSGFFVRPGRGDWRVVNLHRSF